MVLDVDESQTNNPRDPDTHPKKNSLKFIYPEQS